MLDWKLSGPMSGGPIELRIYVWSDPLTLTSLIWIPLAGQLSGPILGSQIEILKFIDICL